MISNPVSRLLPILFIMTDKYLRRSSTINISQLLYVRVLRRPSNRPGCLSYTDDNIFSFLPVGISKWGVMHYFVANINFSASEAFINLSVKTFVVDNHLLIDYIAFQWKTDRAQRCIGHLRWSRKIEKNCGMTVSSRREQRFPIELFIAVQTNTKNTEKQHNNTLQNEGDDEVIPILPNPAFYAVFQHFRQMKIGIRAN